MFYYVCSVIFLRSGYLFISESYALSFRVAGSVGLTVIVLEYVPLK